LSDFVQQKHVEWTRFVSTAADPAGEKTVLPMPPSSI